MTLSSKQRAQICTLKAQGLTQIEIADLVGVSRRTVIRVLQQQGQVRSCFDLNELDTDDETLQDLAQYRSEQRRLASEMHQIALTLLEKSKAAVEALDPGDITPKSLPALLKSVSLLAESASNARIRTTGLEDLLNELEQIGETRAQGNSAINTQAQSTNTAVNGST